MIISRFSRAASVLGAILFLTAPAATQERADLALLSRVETGLWELRSGNGGLIASICLGDRLLLTQPQHGAAACSRNVVAADARSLTVHYTCPGAGFGRTLIRYETPRLVRIESQGVHDGAPFALSAEARRTRACAP